MMTLRTRRVEFREVSKTGVFIAPTEANHENSMSILKKNGFRPLTYQEAIVGIYQNPELKEQLEGKSFYLDGKESQLSGCYTFNDKGELTQGKGDIEKTVYAYSGNKPLSLYVLEDDIASNLKWRFVLGALDVPPDVAGVVVGVRTGYGVATPKIEVAAVEGGVKLTGVTPEQLITLQRNSAQELSKVTEAFGPESLPNTRMLIEALRVKE